MTLAESSKVAAWWPHELSTAKQRLVFCSKVKRVVVLKTVWYEDVLNALEQSAVVALLDAGVAKSAVQVVEVPGALELPLSASLAARGLLRGQKGRPDLVVVLGCVVQGETPHFEFVCSSCFSGLVQVQLEQSMPMGIGVLTVKSLEEARERAAKGGEAARAALVQYFMLKKNR